MTEPSFSFGVVADVQYCDCPPTEVRFYRKSIDKLTECLTTLNQQDLAFTLDVGDLIERDYASFDIILQEYQQASARIYRTLGNHDYSVAPKLLADVPARVGLNASGYYSFIHQGWRFIVLNGTEVSTYAHAPGTEAHQRAESLLTQLQKENRPQAQPWNAGISNQQIRWLEQQLKEARRANQRVIVMGHYPLYPEDPHNLWNAEEVITALEQSGNVVAYFNGHNHAGNYGRKKDIHYLNFKGMVDTPDKNTFAVIHIHPNHLEVQGFGREASRELSFD
ncbi:metallophosphoesterase [Tunicatimonas pelagia]|uniref:metallophosphoesterase n=1 Tax=Tunicatimonas pelagia TaxID=931531 RepID=UPI0026671552|nr:metallophosphoesterase [Tunicatimonas pelagia]WKN41664.1 metallophosphoesterase [Tunicatimonas pelagia]